jgi:hypothetical protein
MGIQTHKIEPHWNYLLAIERDLDELSAYVELDEKNFDCFSIEIARILIVAGAEVDVVCKQICKRINPTFRARDLEDLKISDYRRAIKPEFPEIPRFKVLLPRFGMTLTPWDAWNKPPGVPLWWTACNKIKHQRDSEYHQANLKHALNAVAGLFVMVLHLYKDKAESGELLPNPRLLRPAPQHYGGSSVGSYEVGLLYFLSL